MTLAPTATMHESYSLGRLVAYFLRLGSLGFGGPVALVGYIAGALGIAMGGAAP